MANIEINLTPTATLLEIGGLNKIDGVEVQSDNRRLLRKFIPGPRITANVEDGGTFGRVQRSRERLHTSCTKAAAEEGVQMMDIHTDFKGAM